MLMNNIVKSMNLKDEDLMTSKHIFTKKYISCKVVINQVFIKKSIN